MGSRSEDLDYITSKQALQILRCSEATLSYHKRRGNIRTKTMDCGWRYLYHISDVRKLSWPTTYTVAELAGIKKNRMSQLVHRFKIEGVERVGGRNRINPDYLPKIINWVRRGTPVTKGFIPKYHSINK